MRYCPNCGMQLNDNASVCSNCGHWLNTMPVSDYRKLNVCGLLSMIFGIIGTFFGNLFLIFPIVAIVLAIIALVQHSKNDIYKYKGFAITGLVLGIISIVFWTIMLIMAFRMGSMIIQQYGNESSIQDIFGMLEQFQDFGLFVV